MSDQRSLVGLCVQDYKSLYIAVTTYAILVVPKLICTFWPPVTQKSRSNPTLLYIHVRCTHDANLVTAGSKDTEYKYFCDRLKLMKVNQGDLLFVCDQGSLVGHRIQYYKCLCTAVTICVNLFFPKFDLSILILWPRKVGQVPQICCTCVRYSHNPNLVTSAMQR